MSESPPEKSRLETTKNDETWPRPSEQVRLDEALDLAWVHARDIEYYHTPHCEQEMVEEDRRPMEHTSSCKMCGRTVQSTLNSFNVIMSSGATMRSENAKG